MKIEDEFGRRDGDRRKGCHVCWEVHKKIVKTQCMCERLQKGVCGPGTGRECFRIHAGDSLRATTSECSNVSGDMAFQGTRREREMCKHLFIS